MFACYNGQEAVCTKLLGLSASLNEASIKGLTAYDLAKARRQTAIVTILEQVAKERGVALQTSDPNETLWRAAEAGEDGSTIKEIIVTKKPNIEARDPKVGHAHQP